MRFIFTLLLSLLAAPALAQVTPGTSPLSIPKGGTGGATAAAARTSLGITATGADTTYNFRANNLSDVASAPTARSNLGLAIGSNVQAWDADLDCVAALSTTGVLKRTGTGTCSAGAAALSDLAAGTQDTVIGYFGSTTASAVAIANCTGALTYSTGTHTFGCNVGAGTGTVTNVATAGLAAGGPITATGTITVTAASKTDQQTGTSAIVAVTPQQQQQHDSAVKVHVSFNGLNASCPAGICSIFNSYNINSVARTAAGAYTLNFATAFSSANFDCQGSANAASFSLSTKASGSIGVFTFNGATGVNTDSADVDVVCHGRQ